MDSIFNNIDNSSPDIKYAYFVIPLVFLFIFLKMDIKLNVLVAIIFSSVCILYVSHRHYNEKKYINDIYNLKKESMEPKSNIIEKYDNFVDFLFSIQDFYVYNPPVYESLIDNISAFLELYEDAKTAPELAGINFGLADYQKKQALANLHSIIFNIPGNKIMTNKLNDAVHKLEKLLDDVLREMYMLNKIYIYDNGYNSSTIIINDGPKEANYYEKAPYVFELF